MRAMILAAGRGKRLSPLTDSCPKPLIKVRGKALIEYHLEALRLIGIKHVVINISYLGHQLQHALGTGKKWDLQIDYSIEDPVLETGGGIVNALPLLGDEPFIVLSSDIWTNFPFNQLKNKIILENKLAHLILVDNPEHNQDGDFGLEKDIVVNTPQYTYANIGLYRPELFKACTPGVFPLAPLLRSAISKGLLTGEHYPGIWSDIGTVERLQRVEAQAE